MPYRKRPRSWFAWGLFRSTGVYTPMLFSWMARLVVAVVYSLLYTAKSV